MLRISLCMIVRDEVDNLAACLGSVRGLADEVLVYDTGSHDGTPGLARALGAQVEAGCWSDDFAAARNASLARATGDWVLVLDADEELDLRVHDVREARERLERFATESRVPCGRVRIENRLDDGEANMTDIVRFVRREPGGRFVGRVHEQWMLEREQRLSVPPRADTALAFLHHGYRADVVARRGKLRRNQTLLECEVGERPDDGYAWYQLGRTLAIAQSHGEALTALERALELAADSDEWAVHALELGGESLRALGRSRQALDLIEAALPLAPARTDTRFLAALLALDCGELARAENGFRECLASGPARVGIERSTAAGSWAAAHNLAVICEHTGRADEAAGLYRDALARCPGYRPSREGLARLAGPLPRRPAIG